MEVKNLSFSYNKKKILNQLSIKFETGKINVIIGNNGAGKTTLLHILTHQITNYEGEIIGFDCKQGVLMDTSYDSNLSAKENLTILSKYSHTNIDMDKILNLVGLENTNKKLKHYSLGMKVRFMIAASLHDHSPIIILDEPTNGLDFKGQKEITKLIKNIQKQTGATFIVTSHDQKVIEDIYDCAFYLYNGKAYKKTENSIKRVAIIFNDDDIEQVSKIYNVILLNNRVVLPKEEAYLLIKACIKQDIIPYAYYPYQASIIEYLEEIRERYD